MRYLIFALLLLPGFVQADTSAGSDIQSGFMKIVRGASKGVKKAAAKVDEKIEENQKEDAAEEAKEQKAKKKEEKKK